MLSNHGTLSSGLTFLEATDRQFLLKLDRTATETEDTANVKAESEKKVHEGRDFQYQPVLWPLSGEVPATSQKDQVSGGEGVAEARVRTHRGGKRVSNSCSTSKS